MTIRPEDRRASATRRRLAAAAPTLRLLASGAVLVLVARALPAPATSSGAPRLVLAQAAGVSDDEILLRIGSAAVAADDPVVEARLLKLARYLDLGGTAEHSDEELIATARGVGLAGEDVVIRRYLVEAARLALARPAASDVPDESELRAYHESNATRFTSAARVRATHVYLSASRRGAAVARDAARLLDQLRAHGATPADAYSLGDPFVRGPTIDGTRDVVARGFGAGFARALETVAAGGWQGPVESAYGLHLVWVEQRAPERLTPLDEVRGRVVHALLRERGEARARERLASLRCPPDAADPECVQREPAPGS